MQLIIAMAVVETVIKIVDKMVNVTWRLDAAMRALIIASIATIFSHNRIIFSAFFS